MFDIIIDLFEKLFLIFVDFSKNYFFSLFMLSAFISIMINGINFLLKRYPEEEIEIQKIINPQIKKIKNDSSGKIRHHKIQNIYKRYSYNPLYSLRLLLPFIIQVPFLISIYFMLLENENIKGEGLLFIKDLSLPDGLIFDINILPLLMTLISILFSIFSKKINKTQKRQSFLISIIFLFVLYNSPSSLVIFWTFNSIFLIIGELNFLNKIKKSISKIFSKYSYKVNKIFENFLFSTLILPYLFIKSGDSYFVYFFFPSIIFFIGLDWLTLNRYKTIKAMLFTFLFVFFYAFIFYNDTLYSLHTIRFRYFTLSFLILFGSIFLLISRFGKVKIINLFLIFYSLIILINNLSLGKSSFNQLFDDLNLKTKNIEFSSKKINDGKPLILLIVDELSTSNEVFNITKDSIDFEFERFLKSKFFSLKPEINTHSQQTKISISSLFNFNLGNSDWIKNYEVNNNEFSTTKEFNLLLKKNILIDSLNKKGVECYSFSKINFDKGTDYESNIFYSWDNLGFDNFNYFFPQNEILRKFFLKSMLSFIDSKIAGVSNSDDYQRKKILNFLNNIKFSKKSFYYLHLDAPHEPFSYFNEFPKIDVSNSLSKISENYDSSVMFEDEFYVRSYIKYRRFIQKKIIKILNQKKFGDTRIIIVGDHGLRNMKNFNPYLTQAFFHGFNEEDLVRLHEVQDIGHLINHYLN